jgi:formylglycine-generating enzyme required for sulfatase activity
MGDLLGERDERTSEGTLYSVKGMPAFRMARYLVSNAQFWCFSQNQEYDNRAFWPGEAGTWWERADKSYRQAWTRRQSGDNGHGLSPVGCSFWQAQAYSLWEAAQRRTAGELKVKEQPQLPSEAQWEGGARWAAYRKDRVRQSGEHRWRFAHTPGRNPANAETLADTDGSDEDVFADVTPWDFNHCGIAGWRRTSVGVFLEEQEDLHRLSAATPRDLAGNAWEWTRSAWAKKLDYRVLAAAKGHEIRAVRGGSEISTAANCRACSRSGEPPGNFPAGFRLVLARLL